MQRIETERTGGGELAAAMSSGAVRLMREYTGRGPTKARTYISPDLITVLLEDTLTKGERSLVEDGESALVLDSRRAYQRTMREDLIAMVEQLSGREVVAFLSDNHLEPDVAVECFVLGPADSRSDGASPVRPELDGGRSRRRGSEAE